MAKTFPHRTTHTKQTIKLIMPPATVRGRAQPLYLPDSRFVCFKLSEVDRELEEIEEDLDEEEDVIIVIGLEENSIEGAELVRKISSECMSSLFDFVTSSPLDGEKSELELDRDEPFLAFLLRSLLTNDVKEPEKLRCNLLLVEVRW